MALIRERDSKRLHIKSKLMGESLVSKSFLQSLEEGSSSKPCPMSMYSRSAGKASLIWAPKQWCRFWRK